MPVDCKRQITDLFLQELAHGLKELLSYEGNVEEDFYSTFQVLMRAYAVCQLCIQYKNAVTKHLLLDEQGRLNT